MLFPSIGLAQQDDRPAGYILFKDASAEEVETCHDQRFVQERCDAPVYDRGMGVQKLLAQMKCDAAMAYCLNHLPGHRWEDLTDSERTKNCQYAQRKAAGHCGSNRVSPSMSMGRFCNEDLSFLSAYCE
jgi:hypothetical protein